MAESGGSERPSPEANMFRAYSSKTNSGSMDEAVANVPVTGKGCSSGRGSSTRL